MKNFIKQLSLIKEAKSISGNSFYHSIVVEGHKVCYTRESTGSKEYLLIDELFKVYKEETFINTNVLRKHISGRKYSPSLAILIATELYDGTGFRLNLN